MGEVCFAGEQKLDDFVAMASENEKLRELLSYDFEDVDSNGDRLWVSEEALGDLGFFFAEKQFNDADRNSDGSITETEFFEHQVREIFYALDWNASGALSEKERELATHIPKLFRWLERGALSFVVEGNVAYCNGYIKRRVVKQFKALFKKHPQVNTLVLGWVPGSMDDERMLQALEIIRKHGVDTHARDHARIYSGGVDLFNVGNKRTMGSDVELGVHTWTIGRGKEGRKLSRNHKLHRPYVKYYEGIEVPTAFYWFTLDAANGDQMHLLTEEELKTYRVISSE